MNSPKNKKQKPVASWLDYDILEQKATKSLTVILRTIGCGWRKCTMCGYWKESGDVTEAEAEIVEQLRNALKKSPKEDFILKIFTSGSFFDEREISKEAREEVMGIVKRSKEIKKMIVETRPGFVSEEKIKECTAYFPNLEVAIGLETSNDFIREMYINKGFSFDDYKKAANIVRKCNATIKTYLLLKPPFLSEKKAVEDAIKSAADVSAYTSTISLNLCNVQKGTLLEGLWNTRYYRPPWLWSALKALKEIKRRNKNTVVISDPVGAGSGRGPHNCGKCDRVVKEAIKEFSITQEISVLDLESSCLYCECNEVWEKLIELDNYLFGYTFF